VGACCLLLGGQQVLRSYKTVTKGSDILLCMYVASSIHFPFTTGVMLKFNILNIHVTS
jgi:hypothetical protein